MATITTEFGKLSAKNTRSVYLKIRHGNTVKRLNTAIKVVDSEINWKTNRVKTCQKQAVIDQMVGDLQAKLTKMGMRLLNTPNLEAKDIAKSMVKTKESVDFFAFADRWISKAKIKGLKNYRCMLNTFETFIGQRSIDFVDINYTLLKDFEDYLSDRPRAQSMYLGSIRHLFREAMLEYNTEIETVIPYDPFVKYQVPRQVMKKGVRALTEEDILKIYAYKGEPNSRDQLARDCFILSFCLMGMNSADFYNAKDITYNTIRYNRTKTKDRRSDEAYIEVKIHPFIKELVEKYRGTTHVFNFHSRYCCESTFNQNLNKGLKTVGKAVGIPDLEFYQARHTFATLSRNLMKFSKSDVDEALNHVGSYGIADVYITKDFSIINENNFKLIEKVFSIKPTPKNKPEKESKKKKSKNTRKKK